MKPSGRLGTLAIAAVVVLGLVAAGCGSSSSSSSSSSESSSTLTTSGSGGGNKYPPSFKGVVEKAKQKLTKWPGPTSSPKAAPDSPLVFSIPCSRSAEGCNLQNVGIEEATEALGWRFTSPVDPAGNADKVASAIQQAIHENANVIVLIALDPKLFSGPIAEARKAGIIVACSACGEPAEGTGPTGISQETSQDFGYQGKILAAFVAEDSGGTANVGVLNDPEFKVVQQRYEQWKETFAECTGCKESDYQEFTVAELGPPLGGKAQAMLQSNPDIDYQYVGFDAAAEGVDQAAAQPGAAQAKIVSFDGNKANISLINEGLEYATVAGPLVWLGWATMDNVNREIQSEPIEAGEGATLPSRLVTEETAPEYEAEGFTGDLDYRAKYEELWKTGKTTTAP